MTGDEWPKRLSDGGVIVCFRLTAEVAPFRERVEMLVTRWLLEEEQSGHVVLDDLIREPYTEPRADGDVDLVLEGRTVIGWRTCRISLAKWLSHHGGADLQVVSEEDRVGGETRNVVRISS